MQDYIKDFAHKFRLIYTDNIPKLFGNGTFLAFLSMFCAIESLGAYLAKDSPNNARFKLFIDIFFDEKYKPHKETLWKLRNSIAHSFAIEAGIPYRLTSAKADHFKTGVNSIGDSFTDLNAEAFFEDFKIATENYFEALLKDSTLQKFWSLKVEQNKSLLFIGTTPPPPSEPASAHALL